MANLMKDRIDFEGGSASSDFEVQEAAERKKGCAKFCAPEKKEKKKSKAGSEANLLLTMTVTGVLLGLILGYIVNINPPGKKNPFSSSKQFPQLSYHSFF